MSILESTVTLASLRKGTNTHLPRATTEQLALTFNLDGRTLKAIGRLLTPDAPAIASKKSNVGLWTRHKHYEDFIRSDDAVFSILLFSYLYFFVVTKSRIPKRKSLVYLLWIMAVREKRIVPFCCQPKT